jgi:phage gp16-like protein
MTIPRETRERAARNRALAAIHIAKSQLANTQPGFDDDAYRAVIRRVSAQHGPEVDSAGRLDRTQMVAVLEEFRRLGAKRPGAHKPANYPGKPHNFNTRAMPEMITKIEAQLADMGLSWAYADAIAKRQCGIARVAWVRDEDKLRAIIAALDVEHTKRSCNEVIDELLPKLGIGEKQFAELTAQLPKNWRRNRRHLKAMCNHLYARLEMLEQKEDADAARV